jgi:hypothetical protein
VGGGGRREEGGGRANGGDVSNHLAQGAVLDPRVAFNFRKFVRIENFLIILRAGWRQRRETRGGESG